jgi:hypothetical protein
LWKGAESKGQGAEGRGWREESGEQRSESREQRAESLWVTHGHGGGDGVTSTHFITYVNTERWKGDTCVSLG